VTTMLRSPVMLGVRALSGLVASAGLAYDAYVHFDLAATYDAARTGVLSQGDLFRFEAILAIVAILGTLVRPRRYTAAFAFLVAAGGLGAVLLYRYVDVGSIGPIPSMYEPVWYPEKTHSAWAEAIAAVAAAVLLAALWLDKNRDRP